MNITSCKEDGCIRTAGANDGVSEVLIGAPEGEKDKHRNASPFPISG